MADEQERPDDRPEPASAPDAVKKAPAKKTPAKKAPAKKAPAKAAAKKAPAKKAPVKAPAKAAENGSAAPPVKPAEPNPVDEGAKQAAAQAKSTIEQASDPVSRPVPLPVDDGTRSPVPFVLAAVAALLVLLLVRRCRRSDEDN